MGGVRGGTAAAPRACARRGARLRGGGQFRQRPVEHEEQAVERRAPQRRAAGQRTRKRALEHPAAAAPGGAQQAAVRRPGRGLLRRGPRRRRRAPVRTRAAGAPARNLVGGRPRRCRSRRLRLAAAFLGCTRGFPCMALQVLLAEPAAGARPCRRAARAGAAPGRVRGAAAPAGGSRCKGAVRGRRRGRARRLGAQQAREDADRRQPVAAVEDVQQPWDLRAWGAQVNTSIRTSYAHDFGLLSRAKACRWTSQL